MSSYQPVEVTSWELKDSLEEEVKNNPEMVFQDNVWKVDQDVEFEFTFTGMNDPENFLRQVQSAGENICQQSRGRTQRTSRTL